MQPTRDPVVIREVGLRDGLQSLARVLPTATKLEWLFASMGVPTGQDLAQLLGLRAKLAGWLAGEPLYGTLWRAGLPKTILAEEAR